MTILVLILQLMFGHSHVYAGQNVGVIESGCGFEIIGDPGPFCGVDNSDPTPWLTQQAADNADPSSWGTGEGVSLHSAITAHHHKAYCVKRHYVHAYVTRKGVHVRGHWVKAYCVKAN